MGGGFALARYRVDGSLDPSFDGDRTMTADFGGRDYGQAAPVTAGGKIVVAGGSATTIALTRYWLNGTLDHTFTAGTVTTALGSWDWGRR